MSILNSSVQPGIKQKPKPQETKPVDARHAKEAVYLFPGRAKFPLAEREGPVKEISTQLVNAKKRKTQSDNTKKRSAQYVPPKTKLWVPSEVCKTILELALASCKTHKQRKDFLLSTCTISKTWVRPSRQLLLRDVRVSCITLPERQQAERKHAWFGEDRQWFVDVFQQSRSQLAKLDAFLASAPSYYGDIKKLRITSEGGLPSDEVWTCQEWIDEVNPYSWESMKPRLSAAEVSRNKLYGQRPLRRALRQLVAYLAPCATVQLHLPTSSLPAFVRTFAAHLTEIKGTHSTHLPLAESRSLLRYLRRCQQLHLLRLEGYDFSSRGKLDPLRYLPCNLQKLELVRCVGMGQKEMIVALEDEERLPRLRVLLVIANERELSHDGAIRLCEVARERWVYVDIKL